MKKIVAKLLDKYLATPLVLDAIIACAFLLFSKFMPVIAIKLSDKGQQLQVLNSIIGSSISLAGFILAALTIIVTFKSNITAKGIEVAGNAMELILASHHYNSIVAVFRGAIIEFILVFIVLLSLWINSDGISLHTLYILNCCGIGCVAMAVLRSLWILFSILHMEKIDGSN